MKLSVAQESLNKALAVVGRIVSSRSSLPVLSNVLLSAENNRLKLAVNNLEIGINYWVGCKVEQEGSVTVPARLFSEFISSIPAGNINLTASEANVTLVTPHYNSQFNGISADEFPLIPELTSPPVLTLPAKDFHEAIMQVVVAASPDENRPVLAGVYMYAKDKHIVLVATDSFRLAEKKIPYNGKADNGLSLVVPVRTMQELGRILADNEADVEILVSENQVMFKVDTIEMTSRLIEGQFPNYHQIIPTNVTTTALVDASEFSRIAKVASLFARENAGSIRLQVQAEGQISIASSAPQVGENTSTADCEVEGDDSEISINGRFLTDALGVMKTKSVSFGTSGKLNPCIIRPDGDDGEDYLYIIMPLRS